MIKKLIVAAAVCVLSVGSLIALQYVPDIPERELVYASVSAVWLLLGCIVMKFFTRKMSVVKYLSLRPLRAKDFFIFMWALLSVISGSYLLNYAELSFWAVFDIEMTTNDLAGMSTENPYIMFFSVILIPALFEELFFRGAFLSALELKSRTLSVITSAVFFFLLHGSFFGALPIIYAGAVFGLLTIVTGSIFAAIFAHLINNILSYVLTLYSKRLSVVGLESMVVYLLVFVLLLSAYGLMTTVYRKYKTDFEGEKYITDEGAMVWKNRKQERKAVKKQKRKE